MADAARDFLADRVDLEGRVAAKALVDPAFAEELRQDPKGAVEALLGCELPAALTVRVVEQSATEIVATVPGSAEGALGEDELAAVAGGSMFQDMIAQNSGFLALQQSVQMESRKYQTMSNALRAAHDVSTSSIQNMR